MSVFEPTPTGSDAVRIAALEAAVATITQQMAANAEAAAAAAEEVAAERADGDESLGERAELEAGARYAGDQHNADLIADEIAARVAGDVASSARLHQLDQDWAAMRGEVDEKLARADEAIATADGFAAAAATYFLFDTAQEGVDATVDQQLFLVKGAGGTYAVLYRNEDGVPVATDRELPNKSYFDSVFTGGLEGDVLIKASSADGDTEYVGRSFLAAPPRTALDLTDGQDYQVEVGFYTTNLGVRLASSVSGEALRITYLMQDYMLGGVGLPYVLAPNRRFVLDCTVVQGTSLANTGPAFLVSATPPVPGGPIRTAPSAEGIVWRGSGAVVAINQAGGTPVSVALQNANIASDLAFDEGQVLRVVIDVNDDADGVSCDFYVDGAKVNASPVVVTGLPAGGYIRAYARSGGGIGDMVDIELVEVIGWGLPFTKSIYIDSASPAPRDGSERAPWATIAEAQADYATSPNVESVQFLFKRGADNGVYRGELVIDPKRTRRCLIEAVVGHGVRILPSLRISAGSNAFTQIAGTECWKTPNRWRSLVGSPLVTSGSLIEVTPTVTQGFGLNGQVVVTGRALHTRRAVNLAPGSVGRGDFTVHGSGEHAGYCIVRCYDGGDPNTKDWEQQNYQTAITVQSDADTAWNGMVLEIRNITIECAYNYAIWARRCYIDFANVAVLGTSQLFGMEIDECSGVVRDCFVEGTYADCYHATGGLSTDPRRRVPRVLFKNCVGRGAFASSIGGVGDIFSNHRGHDWVFDQVVAWGAGKDGIAAVDNFTAIDCDCRYNADSGIWLAAEAGNSITARVHGGIVGSNNVGLGIVANENTKIDFAAFDPRFDSNVRASIEAFKAGTVTDTAITIWDGRVYGAVPDHGHVIETGLTVTRKTGAALP